MSGACLLVEGDVAGKKVAPTVDGLGGSSQFKLCFQGGLPLVQLPACDGPESPSDVRAARSVAVRPKAVMSAGSRSGCWCVNRACMTYIIPILGL